MCKSSLKNLSRAITLATIALTAAGAQAQVNVVTAHNDIGRTGQNLQETILTPANVNPTQFGKLFIMPVNGGVETQPLYASQIVIPGKGTAPHNVVYVATQNDYVYAFDADTNGGIAAKPLWQVNLLTNTTPAGTLTAQFGVVGTPAIDLPSKTMYLASAETTATGYIARLHALDITTGAEKFGGPTTIQGSVPGTGTGSVGGVLAFNAQYELQRPGLLLLNGVLYVGYGSFSDQGAWHGWIFSYNAATLKLIDIFCTSPDGTGDGVWMGGAALAAEVYDAAKPYGRMFVATGNGSYQINPPTVTGKPFSNPANEYGMSMLDLDLTGGVMTVEDTFTPFNEALLDGQDGDLGSGGPILLPTQTMSSGMSLKSLAQLGKSGMIYILDRDNNTDGSNNAATEYSPAGLGGFNATTDQVVQEVQTPVAPGGLSGWGAGVWGTEAYWNNTLYTGGTDVGVTNSLVAYSFKNGVLSTTPSSQGTQQFANPGPTPAVSANGATNGIVWAIQVDPSAALLAFDATNLANTLYTSNVNRSRDYTGGATRFAVPTIANGKVYVTAYGQVGVYGLLDNPTAPPPVISPGSATFTNSETVTLSDALAGATIYYTTDGSMPSNYSNVYTAPLVITTNETITAIASVTGYVQSLASTATFTSSTSPANPVFSLASGTYTGTQTLIITDKSKNAAIYYTINGLAPTSASSLYTGPITIPISQTVQAIAIAPGPLSSAIVSANYDVTPGYSFNFPDGFTSAQGPMTFNGSTDLDDFRLQLTNGGTSEAGSAFYATPVNIQQFTTNFTFQLSNPAADGITFTIQNQGPTAVGDKGAGLGYGGIVQSVAIKFDLFNNSGEGPDSTGLYMNGALPTVPAIDLSSSGINLHGGDYMNATLTYDGANLSMTLTDALTLATWSHVWVVNIPAIVGGNTAYVGFTGGTGGLSSSQKLTAWNFVPGPPLPSYASGFAPGSMTLNGGSTYNGTQLLLTDGKPHEARSAFFTIPVNVQQFVTDFQFQLTNAYADGMTFTIQGNSPTALGAAGEYLGYGPIGKSIAVKFDLYSNAGEGPNCTGLYTNGATPTLPSINLPTTGINLHSGDIINVQMAYNGTTLTVVMTDTLTGATAVQNYTVNIPALVGAPQAYVGFTAGTGGEAAVQAILNWVYSPQYATGPEFANGFAAAAPQLTLNNGAALSGTRLRLTDGNPDEKRSAFFTNTVNVQQFVTNFGFQLTNPAADGFTFTIQGNGPGQVGNPAMGLGYAPINKSVAVKFDLFSDAGEGPDSTGMYLNGAEPTTPSVDLSTTGINLHSGDTFNVQMGYNGITLTVVITDTVTGATATENYAVDIPSIVGGPTAHVGFTASTGGQSAVQDILNWTYSSEVAN